MLAQMAHSLDETKSSCVLSCMLVLHSSTVWHFPCNAYARDHGHLEIACEHKGLHEIKWSSNSWINLASSWIQDFGVFAVFIVILNEKWCFSYVMTNLESWIQDSSQDLGGTTDAQKTKCSKLVSGWPLLACLAMLCRCWGCLCRWMLVRLPIQFSHSILAVH